MKGAGLRGADRGDGVRVSSAFPKEYLTTARGADPLFFGTQEKLNF